MSEPDFDEDRRLRECERRIGYRFRRRHYLHKALTHSSIKNELNPSNERLEFLGDSVVGMVVSEYLYGALPDVDEGELTRVKSVAVSTRALAHCAEMLELHLIMRVNKGIAKRTGLPPSILANVFEAVTAAIYLDGGLEEARIFVLQALTERIAEVLEDRHAQNWKSLLQQLTQREYGSTPIYRVLREVGPDHRKEFLVAAVVEAVEYGAAVGSTKKEAEQSAARLAWEQLRAEAVERGRSARRKAKEKASDEPAAPVPASPAKPKEKPRPKPPAPDEPAAKTKRTGAKRAAKKVR